MNIPSPTGQQHRLVLGDQRATVTEVGAHIREYVVAGRDVLVPFREDQIPPAGHGAVLAPWPNRLRDGRYTWDGVERELPITEPSRGTALHGLVQFVRWSVPADVAPTDTSVTLEHDLVPTKGYPFPLRLRATYTLNEDGLHVRVAATNLGDADAPYGVGFHPWLSPGSAELDECTARLDARTHVTVDDRLLPTGTEPATGDFDLAAPRSLQGIVLDDAWLDVVRDADGLSWIHLTAPDGRTAAVWMDDTMDTWQACTGDGLPGVNRNGLAAEPMSCVADAFRTGDRLVRLTPGATHEVTWGVTLL